MFQVFNFKQYKDNQANFEIPILFHSNTFAKFKIREYSSFNAA